MFNHILDNDKDLERAMELNCVKFAEWGLALSDYKKRHKIAISKGMLVDPPSCCLNILPYFDSSVPAFKEEDLNG
jgi:hypothetical protein